MPKPEDDLGIERTKPTRQSPRRGFAPPPGPPPPPTSPVRPDPK